MTEVNLNKLGTVVEDALVLYLAKARKDLEQAKKKEEKLMANYKSSSKDLISSFNRVMECELLVEQIEKETSLLAWKKGLKHGY